MTAAVLTAAVFSMGFACTRSKEAAERVADPDLPARLERHVRKLADDIGQRNLANPRAMGEAAGYIAGELRSYGYEVELQDFTVDGLTAANIIAAKAGLAKPGETILVGAHYDTCAGPGADDNASGVAGLLELARFCAEKRSGRTVRFAAFANEEPPYFQTEAMGSLVYARAARARGERIEGAVILEMIGYFSDEPRSQQGPPLIRRFYPSTGNFLLVAGNLRSHSLAARLVAGFKRGTHLPIRRMELGFVPGVDFSDHWSFWQAGYTAVMVTDTAFYRNAYYHSHGDTPEKLDYARMAQAVLGLAQAVEGLAEV